MVYLLKIWTLNGEFFPQIHQPTCKGERKIMFILVFLKQVVHVSVKIKPKS